MNNVLYRGLITPAHASADGETPDCIYVTQESNGFAIFRSNLDGTQIIDFLTVVARDAVIERGVDETYKARRTQFCAADGLVLAAPDMLKALKGVRNIFDDPDGDLLSIDISAIRAAINKAEEK